VYCNKNSPNLNQTFNCVFDISRQNVEPAPEDISGKYQVAVGTNAFSISKDYGVTWESKPEYALYNFTAVAISEDGKYIVAGPGGASNSLYRSIDGGDSFDIVPDTDGVTWSKIAMSKSGQYVTATGGGTGINFIFISKNYGTSFNKKPLAISGGYYGTYLSMSYSGQYQTIMETGTSNYYISSNFGVSFEPRDASIFAGGVSGSSTSADGQIQMAVDQYWRVYKSVNYGNDFSQVADLQSQGVTELYFISISGTGQYQLIPSPSNYLFVSNNSGANFSTNVKIDGVVQGINSWLLAQVSSSGKYQTATDSSAGPGYIYTSSDYGKSFTKSTQLGNWTGLCMS